LLLDPTPKRSTAVLRWSTALYATASSDPDGPTRRDSATFMPLSVVVNPYFDWADDRSPNTPLHQS
jgi:glycogen operon protein